MIFKMIKKIIKIKIKYLAIVCPLQKQSNNADE